MEFRDGFQCLVKSLKRAGGESTPVKSRDYMFEGQAASLDKIYRVADQRFTKTWYGFIYHKNDGATHLDMDMMIKFQGGLIYQETGEQVGDTKLSLAAG